MIVRGEAVFMPGILAFPGGKVELVGDAEWALEETARREVREEVRVELDDEIVYVESHVFTAGATPVLDVVVLARYRAGEPHPAAPGEVASVAWMTPGEIVAHPGAREWTVRSLELVEEKRRQVGF